MHSRQIFVVWSVASGSPAEKAGLKAGDVVLGVDGRAVSSPRQLLRVLGSYEPGEPLKLEVMRQKKRVTLKGTLGR